jgi:multicomponent K+:H+ antiporter subunit A
VAIAFIMQYMASGYGWAAAHKRIEAHSMIGAGVLVAGLTGIGSWVFGFPFLTSTYDYFHLPLIGEFELASAIAFDIGVFLTVVGTVLLALSQIFRVGRRAEREPVPEGPMDRPPPDLDELILPAAAGPACRKEI